MQSAGKFSRTTTVHDLVAADQISDRAESIMNTASCLVNDLITATSDEDGQGLGLGTLFNHEHAFVSGTEMEFSDLTGKTELFRTNFLETRNDTGTSGHGDQLDVDSANPTHGRKLILEQKMVCLVIETPLTKCNRSTRVLDSFDHIYKIFLFLLI